MGLGFRRHTQPVSVINVPQLITRLAVALLVVLIGTFAFAQTGGASGRIAGSVQDGTGAVVPGSTITVTNVAKGTTFTATSSSEGAFVVPEIPAGMYTVSFDAKGFSKRVYSAVK